MVSILQRAIHTFVLSFTLLLSFSLAKQFNPQAKSIENSAVTLSPGFYTFTNVQSGQKLEYISSGNHIFPASVNPGTTISIVNHPSNNWHRFSFGEKSKCLSAAWGGNFDNSAVAYACAVGPNAQRSTLETSKQWWVLIDSNSKVKRTFDLVNSSTVEDHTARRSLEKRKSRHHRHHHHHHSSGGKGGSNVNSGTFYIIPVDHLYDQTTRALTGQVVKSRGIRSTQLDSLQMGNKLQQWQLQRHN